MTRELIKKIDNLEQIKYGILMMVISSFSFSLMAIIVKSLKDIPLMQLIFYRNLPTFLVLPYFIKLNGYSLFGNNKFLLLLRAFFGLITTIGLVFTFMKMNLTDAMAIRQLSPFIIILLSGYFLKEKISSNQFLVLNIAFIGALLVIRPGLNYQIYPAIIGLIAVFSSAVAQIILRKLRFSDCPLVIVHFFSFFSLIISIVIILVQGNFYIPNKFEILLLLCLGFVSFIAQFTLSYSYKLSPANVVSIYLYSGIFFTALLDFTIYNVIPDYFSILGCLLIVFGGYIHYKNKAKV